MIDSTMPSLDLPKFPKIDWKSIGLELPGMNFDLDLSLPDIQAPSMNMKIPKPPSLPNVDMSMSADVDCGQIVEAVFDELVSIVAIVINVLKIFYKACDLLDKTYKEKEKGAAAGTADVEAGTSDTAEEAADAVETRPPSNAGNKVQPVLGDTPDDKP